MLQRFPSMVPASNIETWWDSVTEESCSASGNHEAESEEGTKHSPQGRIPKALLQLGPTSRCSVHFINLSMD